jgi:hypothetical protein
MEIILGDHGVLQFIQTRVSSMLLTWVYVRFQFSTLMVTVEMWRASQSRDRCSLRSLHPHCHPVPLLAAAAPGTAVFLFPVLLRFLQVLDHDARLTHDRVTSLSSLMQNLF